MLDAAANLVWMEPDQPAVAAGASKGRRSVRVGVAIGMGIAALATPYLLTLPSLPSGQMWRMVLGVCVAPLMLGCMMLLADRTEKDAVAKKRGRICRINPGALQFDATLVPASGIRGWSLEPLDGAGQHRLVIDRFGDAEVSTILPDAATAAGVRAALLRIRPERRLAKATVVAERRPSWVARAWAGIFGWIARPQPCGA